jgi:hypothetical protein
LTGKRIEPLNDYIIGLTEHKLENIGSNNEIPVPIPWQVIVNCISLITNNPES